MNFCSNVFSRGGRVWGTLLFGLWFCGGAQGQNVYFVNDLSTTGDVYTAAIGSDANSGTSSNAPKLTLTNLLANVSLLPGDVVYIDTGVYSNYTVTITNSGAVGSPIIFQGSTNIFEGGSVFDRGNTNADVFVVSGSRVSLRNITLQGGRDGLALAGSSVNGSIDQCNMRYNSRHGVFEPSGGTIGWQIKNSILAFNGLDGLRIDNSFRAGIENCIFWRNGGVAIQWIRGSGPPVRSSVIVGGTSAFWGSGSLPSGDHNVIWDVKLKYDTTLAAYLEELGMTNSVYADPEFVNPDSFNFIPKSTGGRYDLLTGSIVTDAVHSILIDLGNPGADASSEPDLNGGRINAGAYGGTIWASRSAAQPYLATLSFNDGGGITGQTARLRWHSGGFGSNDTVAVQYLEDLTTNWLNIATGVPVTNSSVLWDVSGISPMAAKWRVISESDSSVVASTPRRFSIKGFKVPYFVNDLSPTNDIYTTVLGDDANDGLTPSTPKLTLTNMLSSFRFGGFDRVYVDAGVYSNYTVTVPYTANGSPDSGYFSIKGVPGGPVNGTIFNRGSKSFLSFNLIASYVELASLTIRNGARIGHTTGLAAGQPLVYRDLYISDMGSVYAGSATTFSEWNRTLVFSNCVFVGNGSSTAIQLDAAGLVSSRVLVFNSVFWSNNLAVSLARSASASMSNSVVVGGTTFSSSAFDGDYNIFWNTTIRSGFSSLDALRRELGVFTNSIVQNPLFADPLNGNFFPMSMTISGRYDVATGLWTNDAVHSPLIDFGDPASTLWTNEPAPNGNRLNIGAYGGTVLASKSRTNRWLQVLSLTDGGDLGAGLGESVRWIGGNYAPGQLVTIQLSTDGGTTWQTAATGIEGSAGTYVWANTNFSSSVNSRWRVVDQADTNILSQTAVNFTFRNGPFVYFINDSSSRAGDIYTGALGNDANTGTSSNSPKASLAGLLADPAVNIIPGDIIYIDTGTYTLTSNIVINSGAGNASNLVKVIASTNTAAGGTLFNRNSISADGIILSANYWQINDLNVRNARTGILFNNSEGSELVRVHLYDHQEDGVRLDGTSSNVVVRHSVLRNNRRDGLRVEGSASSATIQHSVFWNNTNAGIRVNAGSASVTNSVLVATGPRTFAYHAATTNSIRGDFNSLHAASNAVAGFIASLGRNADTITSWQRLTGQESRSLGVEPEFVNAGAGNFRLSAGSDLIDRGDPGDDVSAEPLPNGGRVNIGLYGGTSEAEVGTLGARLLAVSPRDGGWMAGTNEFRWAAYDVAADATVAIELSTDGATWSSLAAGVSATNEVFAWDSTVVADTPAARWRVTLEGSPEVNDESGSFFSIRNSGPLGIYVNDGVLDGDAFTSAAGAATNWVATSNAPMNLLSSALALYDLEPGDTVYVDTGVYNETNVVAARRVSGSASAPVRIVGASDEVAGGVRIDRGSSSTNAFGIEFQAAAWNSISNITVRSAYQGLRLVQADNNRFSMLRVINNAQHGVFSTGSTNNIFVNSLTAFNGGAGYRGEASSSANWINSVVWSNAAGAMAQSGGLLSVTNSVLMAHGSGRSIYDASATNVVRADYNNLVTVGEANTAKVGIDFYGSPIQWQLATSNDLRSLSHDPKFADAAAGDFHPQSPFGRYEMGSYVTNGSDGISPLIDTGNPASPFANEPIPNGGRINIGFYGNTAQASKSDTNGFLLALTLNSGGTVRGTNTFYWTAGGPVTGHTVWVQFSRDGGATWSNVASVAASAGSFTINTATIGTGTEPVARWRVQSQTDTNILGATESTFIINNGPLTFYVNDASTNGNVYTTAAGSPANSGTDTNAPLDSIQSVIQRYGTRPGDRIFVDTGVYTNTQEILLTGLNSGTLTNRILIQGSTNLAAGGTRIVRPGSGRAIYLNGATNVTIRHLTIEHQGTGVAVASPSANIDLEWLNVAGGTDGFDINGGLNVAIRNSSARNGTGSGVLLSGTTTGFRLLNSVLWSNRFGVNQSGAGSVAAISNSVIGVFATNGLAIRKVSEATTTTANFNNYVLTNGALMAGIDLPTATSRDIYYRSVSTWARASQQDRQSLGGHDPRFVNPGVGDFRLKSAAGHALFEGGFSSGDGITSPLIDAGDPGIVATNELVPNGGRIDIGQYGNSRWASATPTNGWLTVVSLNDGGRIEGTTNIFWVAGGVATNHGLLIEYSADDGVSWSTITNGIAASAGQVVWDTTLFDASIRGRWRITSTNDPSVSATNDRLFAVRNQPLFFYVNDGDDAGDVYTEATGSVTNSGVSADSPKPGLMDIFKAYEVQPGDTIFVDTGSYTNDGSIGLGYFESGSAEQPLIIQGSTNWAAGGSRFYGSGSQPVFLANESAYVAYHYLNLFPATGAGMRMQGNSDSNSVSYVRVSGGSHGFDLDNARGVMIRNSSVRNATGAGVLLGANVLGFEFINGVLWSNQFAVNLNAGTASVSVRNSILGASGASRYAYRITVGGNLVADHNNLVLQNGAEAGLLTTSPNTIYPSMSRWVAGYGRDVNSLSEDPRFVAAGEGDFRLLSDAGYTLFDGTFSAGGGVTSPLIDAGDPASGAGEETGPNGGRVNIGMFGGTSWASKTPADDYLATASLNDESFTFGSVLLRWIPRGDATGHAFRVEYTLDGGEQWVTLVATTAMGATTANWDTTLSASAVLGQWRVTSLDDPGLSATSRVFAVRNTSIPFYINDGSTEGDVYTSVAGSPSANGTVTNKPISSLNALLALYDLEPGDVVYMDTGSYTNAAKMVIGAGDAGIALIGSTNTVAGGTQLVFSDGVTTGLELNQAPGNTIRHLRFGPVATAVDVISSSNTLLHGLQIAQATTGIRASSSPNVTIENSSVRNSGTGISLSTVNPATVQHVVLWSNTTVAIDLAGTTAATVQNSAFGVFANSAYRLAATATLQSDYNNFYLQGNGRVAERPVPGLPSMIWERVGTWSRETGRDRYSLTGDPGFANADAGDFHLVSAAGRFNPVTGSFTNDLVSSRLIDAGNPASAFSNETGSNGGRVNIGMCGNTREASRTPTNAVLTVARFDDGGRTEASPALLTWTASGVATGFGTKIEVSYDDGVSWSFVTNAAAGQTAFSWAYGTNASWLGRWRMSSLGDASLVVTNNARFVIGNGPLALYVNDGVADSTDVYTVAAGTPENSGTSPAAPRDGIQSLLDEYDLDPGDTIYVDTGSYVLTQAVAVGRFDAWNGFTNLTPLISGGVSVTIQGSTHEVAGGSEFVADGSFAAFDLNEAYGVALRHVRVRRQAPGTGTGLALVNSRYGLVEWSRFEGFGRGVSLTGSDATRLRHVVIRDSANEGLWLQTSPAVSLVQSVLWSNRIGASVQQGGVLRATNNVIAALALDSMAWQRNDQGGGSLIANYNLIDTVPGALVGELTGNQYLGGRRIFETLQGWQAAITQDVRSVVANSLFANAAGGDFHPQSPFGRFVAGSGYVTNMGDGLSLLIDAGDPAVAAGNEPAVNGGRANIGLYGTTEQASKSPGDGLLQVLSFNDGGSVSSNAALRWVASGSASTGRVTLAYLAYGGTWTVIATNVAASAQQFDWVSPVELNSAAVLWRVTSEEYPAVASTNDVPFTVRNAGSIDYYVATDGHDSASGFSPAEAKATLQGLLDGVDLEPGDVVHVGPGMYTSASGIMLGQFDAGTSNTPVVIRGSTNRLDGETVLLRSNTSGPVLLLEQAPGVRLEHVVMQGGNYGVSAVGSDHLLIREVTVKGSSTAGIRIAGSLASRIENSLIWSNALSGILAEQFSVGANRLGVVEVINNTIWSNRYGINIQNGGRVAARNNLIQSSGALGRLFFFASGQTNLVSDYNALYRVDGASIGERQNALVYQSLTEWQKDRGNDLRSLTHDPLVVDAAAGDFHLLSAAGYFTLDGAFANAVSGVYSPLIDAGDPETSHSGEAFVENGERVNIGRYGNTPEASRSRPEGWLLALSYNDTAEIEGTNRIYWAAGGWASNATVRIEYAADGDNYSLIVATNLPVYQDGYDWDVSDYPSFPAGRWRVVSESNPAIFSAIEGVVSIKNEPLIIYVNDGTYEEGVDVYTEAAGSPDNTGLSPDSPLDNPATALELFPFAAGDVLFIDTGNYNITNDGGMRVGIFGDFVRIGSSNDPFRIIGSTNAAAGGTRIAGRISTGFGLKISDTHFIEVENLNFSGVTNGVVISGATNITLRNVESRDNRVGFALNNAAQTRIEGSAAWNNVLQGLLVEGAQSSVTWRQGVLWGNAAAGIRLAAGSLSVSNTIVESSGALSVLYEIAGGTLGADYNVYWSRANTNLMRVTTGSLLFQTLQGWQANRNTDTHSVRVDPLFADAAGGDFHLRSEAGRWDVAAQEFVLTDTNTSWAIDAGAPGDAFGLETDPNGGRVNAGRYGNTAEASRSVTNNRALFAATLRDGVDVAWSQRLVWLTRGLDSNATVRLEYTLDDGLSWVVMATNVPASDFAYTWDTEGLDATPLGRWRIVLEGEEAVSDETVTPFYVRNAPIHYYVNDAYDPLNDIYTTAAGHDANDGVSPARPVASVAEIFNRYELRQGDTVYIDTGVYDVSANVVVAAKHFGTATNRVRVLGSTNKTAGGTVLGRSGGGAFTAGSTEALFEVIGAKHIEFADLLITNANAGVWVRNITPATDVNNLLFRNIEIRDGGYYGVRLAGSGSNRLERVLVHRMSGFGMHVTNSANTEVESSVFWANALGAVSAGSSSLRMTNSVLHAFGGAGSAALRLEGATAVADYNNYVVEGESPYVIRAGEPFVGLPQYTRFATQDVHSLSVDPGFADPANNDFHVRSATGRWDPATNDFVTGDAETSWMIDTGDPAAGAVGSEELPNGGRRNIGLYGGTAQASKSRTNAWLLAITGMNGGRLSAKTGAIPLRWAYGNLDATNTVAIEYMTNESGTWLPVASGLAITNGGYGWSTNVIYPVARWRVVLEANTNVAGATFSTFGLNGPFTFYVNDDSTDGDVFTGAVGNDANTGLSSNEPMATLSVLLNTYDLDPEDEVWIDTGVYAFTTNNLARILRDNRGAQDLPVVILGSPAGTVWSGGGLTVLTVDAPYVVVSNVVLQAANVSVLSTNVVLQSLVATNSTVTLAAGSALNTVEGFRLSGGGITLAGNDGMVRRGRMSNSVVTISGARGSMTNVIMQGGSPQVTISGANASLVNNTLVSGGIAVRQTGGTGAVLRNNILVAAGASGFAIERTGGTMTSDYNLFDMRNGAWFGPAAGGLWEKLVYWQQQTGLDSNSVAASALFADEAGGDLHVKSVAGRWDGAGWVTDGEHSPAIDAGAPGDNVRDEPDGENGGRINIGAYGGTAEASKSRAGAWLQALTLNDGGVLRGTHVLRWNYGGMAATNRVLAQYSVDGGTNWATIATVAVTARAYAWDSSVTNSLDGAWRVVLEADAGVSDATDRGVAIRNGDPREFYVSRDGSDSTGDGRSAGTAMATLTNVLATYDLEAGDAVRVGSGVYTNAAPVTVIWSRGGTNGNPVAITGSDDPAAPTVLRRATLAGEAMLVQASHVALEHLVFENAVNGLALATNVSVSVDQVEARSNTVGIAIRSGGPHAVTSSRVRNNAQGGVLLSAATNATIANVTLANNGGYGVSVTGGTGLTLKNNIFYQGQDTAYAAYAGATSVVVSAGIDYNVYWFDPAVATGAVIYAGYPELGAWQRERLKDLRSEMIDPALQDVAGGDLHVKSEYGRYDAGTAAFVNDGETSWAIDRGDPYSSYVREPADANGRRINIGAYGNTAWASKSSATATGVTVETGAEFLDLDESENPYLVRWWLRDVDSVPSNLTYTIQFSGDGGVTWTHLRTGLSVFDEVYRWTNSPVFNTFKGKFRLQGEGTNSGVTATSEDVIWTFIGEHAFTGVAAEEGQPVRVIWRGAWGEEYRVFGTTNLMNTNAWTQLIATNLARGGDTVYTDTGATDRVFRVYRVLWSNTNDYPVP